MPGVSGEEKKMTLVRYRWVIWLVVLILSAYIVPYYLIGHIARVYASFLYWTVFALLAIIAIMRISAGWRD
jgi:hypothetical protein